MKRLLLLSLLLLMSNLLIAQGWGQTQKIVPVDRQIGDEFGWSISLQGDTAAVGAKLVDGASVAEGAVYMYVKDASNNWLQAQKVSNSNTRQFDQFGSSVDIDGNFMIIGARGQDYDENGNNFVNAAGAAYIFENDGSGNWSQIQKLVASDRGTFQPLFGETVAISGNYAVVNSPKEDKGLNGQEELNSAGACYVFERDGSGIWNEVQKIVASDRHTFDYFGDFAIAIDGDILVVGANYEDEDETGMNTLGAAGSAYIFERDGSGTWNEVQKIVASDREQGEWFGESVGISGNTIIVGAENEYLENNMGAQYGAAYIFNRDTNGAWNQIQKVKPDALYHGSRFGHSIDMDGNRVVIGADRMDIGSVSDGGAAFMFDTDDTGLWFQTAVMYDTNVIQSDYFGFSVALSGDYAFVGAYQEDEDETNQNTLQSSGAAFIFDVNEPNTLESLSTLSIVDSDFKTTVRAYPNPVENILNIDLSKYTEVVSISVYNYLGQKIISKMYTNTSAIKLPLEVSKGIYLVELILDSKYSSVIKIVKQ